VLPRLKDLPNYTPPDGVIIVNKTNGTFNDDVICKYIESVVSVYMQSYKLTKVCLIIDSAQCHKTVKVLSKCAEFNIKHMLIPPRLTGLLQPADVCWFSGLKKHYHRLWANWFLNEEKTYTRFDNVRSPGYAKCISWLLEMWLEFPNHLIINSFESCGIISQLDLHSALKEVLKTNVLISDYVDNYEEADNIDGFEDSNDLFDEVGEIETDINVQTSNVEHNNNDNVLLTNSSVNVNLNFDAVDQIPSGQNTPNELIFNQSELINNNDNLIANNDSQISYTQLHTVNNFNIPHNLQQSTFWSNNITNEQNFNLNHGQYNNTQNSLHYQNQYNRNQYYQNHLYGHQNYQNQYHLNGHQNYQNQYHLNGHQYYQNQYHLNGHQYYQTQSNNNGRTNPSNEANNQQNYQPMQQIEDKKRGRPPGSKNKQTNSSK
jgi:hypothetical protein